MIMQTVRFNLDGKDSLIWLPSKSGNYSTKEAYKKLVHTMQYITLDDQFANPIWGQIWKIKGVAPRIITFIWRALHDALPTAQKLNRIFPYFSLFCPRCGQQAEDIMHMLFLCHSCRAVWFASELCLRVDDMPPDFMEVIELVLYTFQSKQATIFYNIIWQIRKARCDFVFKGEAFQVTKVFIRADAAAYSAQVCHNSTRGKRVHINKYEVPVGASIVLIDGSWDQQHRIGISVLVYDPRGKLHSFMVYQDRANDAFVAEAMALCKALNFIKPLLTFYSLFHIFSDSQILVHIINNSNLQDAPSWHADQVLTRCFNEAQSTPQVAIRYAKREHVAYAHVLSNEARTKGSQGLICSEEYHQGRI